MRKKQIDVRKNTYNIHFRSFIKSSTYITCLHKLAGLSTSHVFKYGEHDFPGKSPYRGVTSRPNSQLQCVGGGGGGRRQSTLTTKKTLMNIPDFLVRESSIRQMANFINYLGNYRQIWRNLETRRYASKSGDYRHKSGDREIRFKIWRLPDHPGELTALNLMTALYISQYVFFLIFLQMFRWTCY